MKLNQLSIIATVRETKTWFIQVTYEKHMQWPRKYKLWECFGAVSSYFCEALEWEHELLGHYYKMKNVDLPPQNKRVGQIESGPRPQVGSS